MYCRLLLVSLLTVATLPIQADDQVQDVGDYDVVIYGGTSAGVAAAVQVKRMGRSVIVIEPTSRLGGLTSGGLGQTDIGNKAAIGGIAREFYRDVRRHYQQPSAWRWQKQADYSGAGQSKTSVSEETMWTFEPSVAVAIFNRWVSDNQIEVDYGQRLDRDGGVAMTRSCTVADREYPHGIGKDVPRSHVHRCQLRR